MKPLVKHITVVCLYTFVTGLLLWPLPLHPGSSLLAAQSGDPLMQVWVVHWNIHKLTTSLAHYFDANILYPYPNTFAFHDHLFALGVMGLPTFTLTQNPILTYNLLFFLAFILSAYTMFWLSRDLTRNDAAALLAGLIFGFLPYRFAHLDHLNLLSIQWLPACFLFLRRSFLPGWRNPKPAGDRIRWRPVLGFWGCFLLQALTSFNYLFMLTFAVGVAGVAMLAGALIFRVRPALNTKTLIALLVGGCVAGLLLLPFVRPYLQVNRTMGFERTLAEAAALSARPQNYLAAPDDNLLYGRLTRRFQASDSPFPREQVLFCGLLPIGLALVGLASVRRQTSPNKVVWFTCLIVFGVAVILSFGPSVALFGKTVTLPYAWLYRLVPGFKAMRVPARFGLLAAFALTILAAFGATRVLQAFTGGQAQIKRGTTAALFGGLLVVEFATMPHELSVYPAAPETIPAEYRWLAAQPDETRIIELPARTAKDNFEYTYYSMFHWQPMINGRSAFIPTGIVRVLAEMHHFPSTRTLEILQSLKINYVLLHTEKLAQPPPAKLPDGLTLAHTFGKTLVFEIAADRAAEERPAESREPPLLASYVLPTTLRPDRQYTVGLSLASRRHTAFSPLPHEKATVRTIWILADEARQPELVEERKIELPLVIPAAKRPSIALLVSTPAEPGDYQVTFTLHSPLFRAQPHTKRVTLLPDMPDSRRPAKLQAEFLRVDAPAAANAGAPLPVRVWVKNTGDTLWLARVPDRRQPVGEVHLGVVGWYDASGAPLPQQDGLGLSRGFLPHDVAPGQEVRLTVQLATPERAGAYQVELNLVSELIQWFPVSEGRPPMITITLHE
jgi:hypothetical protein